MMLMCGNDWTYDMFVEDAKKYQAKPMRGIYCSSRASDREKFMTWFKGCARDFKEAWLKEHDGRMYDRYDGYIGDAFKRELPDMCFSDYYKDVYNQRPHLDRWYYIHLLDLPMSEDTARTFCAWPIKEAVNEAQRNREWLESL